MKSAVQNCMTEFSLVSGKAYRDPFNEVTVDVVFTGPDGNERIIPAFWAGDNVWRIRFSSPLIGRHSYRSVCSDATNVDLHAQEGITEVTAYRGNNELLKRGPLRVSANRRHLEHGDGTPFFWLADTWWMGLVKRLGWPEDFQLLTADRTQKGFSVIQIVAGLYPDMPPFDERGANEAGFPWEKDFSRINPAYFDMADLRINWLVSSGLVPCIVACWGYFLDFAGVEVLKKHWRYLVARWGAHPVVWCLAGEVLMPYYLHESWDSPEQYRAWAKAGWSDVARYLRSIDPYHHPVTAHQSGEGGGRGQVEEGLVDIDLLQTGCSDRMSIPYTVKSVTAAYAWGSDERQEPSISDQQSAIRNRVMPVINGEVCYEGVIEANRQEIQRFMFWCCMLSGAAGHTYGANGIWQMNTKVAPFGPGPHGAS